MSEFDKWYADKEFYSVARAARESFEAGQQSQQAKIDELQKRIDEIVDLVCNNTPDYYLDNMIEDIIKGNKDEK